MLWNEPAGWDFAEPLIDGQRVAMEATEGIDVIIAFATEPDQITTIGSDLAPLIYPAGSLWVAWPRKAAGHHSGVTEQLLRDILLPRGIVDTKVAAIDHDWSGLKFVWRKELRSHPSARQASASYMEIEGC